MTPNDIEIQTPVAIRLVPAGTAEELGCTTARYDVAVTVNTSEKRIGCLTVAPKPIFGGGTSCFSPNSAMKTAISATRPYSKLLISRKLPLPCCLSNFLINPQRLRCIPEPF